MRLDGLTFDQAMQEAYAARDEGYVGISIFHKHDYEALEGDGVCYSVYGYTSEELAKLRKEAEEPEPPLPTYEITHWGFDGDGDQVGEHICGAETMADLLKQASEQNGTET